MSKTDELLQELTDYAYEVRCDWSDFDGRTLMYFIDGWAAKMKDAIEKELQ